MRKLIAFVVGVATVLGTVTVFAQNDTTVTGYRSGDVIISENTEESITKAVLNVYSDGLLTYSTMAVAADDVYTFNVPSEHDGSRMRICYIGNETYEFKLVDEPTVEPTEIPTEAPTEEPTEVPTEAPTEKPTRTPIPEVYDRALDALNAPAVVMDVNTTMIDGEMYHELTMLYQGNEVSTYVRDWVTIASAPANMSGLIGKDASALDEGDVIHFTNDLQGRIKSIEFIYRHESDNYIEDETVFGTLIGSDGFSSFAFGVPIDKTKGSITLADETGAVTELDINSKVFVYKVSSANRSDKVTLEGAGYSPIETNYVHKTSLDDDGNVISWDDVDVSTYALVRTVSGNATEIILFGE